MRVGPVSTSILRGHLPGQKAVLGGEVSVSTEVGRIEHTQAVEAN